MLDQAAQLARWLRGTDIEALELTLAPDPTIRLRREPDGRGRTVPAAAAVPAPPPAPARTLVRAGCVGVALHSHPLRQAALVQVGEQVRAGQVLALLKIGKLLRPVAAPCEGTVTRIVAPHGAVVGYGDTLVELG